MNWPTVDILGVRVHCVDYADTLAQIGAWIDESSAWVSVAPRCDLRHGSVHQICTVNPEFIMEARCNAHFAAVLQRADLCVPDGIGVVWAARLLGAPVRERVTGSDGIYHICQRAAQEGWRVYLLGAGPGVAARAAARLQQRYPGLIIAGAHSGGPDAAHWPAIARRLYDARADVLFVAFGHPRQELWIDRHRNELPVTVAIGVGGAFDFVAGVTRRAPRWMQRIGVEWLHRLIQQPWRWRRMVVLPRFAALLLGQRLVNWRVNRQARP